MERNACLVESMLCHIGKTITVYTTSGGASGCGFTGVLASVTCDCIRLITDIGEAPACSIGSSCCKNKCNNYNIYNNYNKCKCNKYNYTNSNSNNWLGSVTDIPICAIACFTHHTI